MSMSVVSMIHNDNDDDDDDDDDDFSISLRSRSHSTFNALQNISLPLPVAIIKYLTTVTNQSGYDEGLYLYHDGST